MKSEPLTDAVFDEIEKQCKVHFTPEQQQTVRYAAWTYHQFHNPNPLAHELTQQQTSLLLEQHSRMSLLEGFGDDARRLAVTLERATTGTNDTLFVRRVLQLSSIDLDALFVSLGTIADRIEDIFKTVKRGPGRPKHVWFPILVDKLAKVFREAGGEVKPASHYESKDRYSGDFFLFVYGVLAACDDSKMNKAGLASKLNRLFRDSDLELLRS